MKNPITTVLGVTLLIFWGYNFIFEDIKGSSFESYSMWALLAISIVFIVAKDDFINKILAFIPKALHAIIDKFIKK